MRNRAMSMSVPQAGRKYYGLSKNGSYNALWRGDLPATRFGRLWLVTPRNQRAIERKLGIERSTEAAPDAA